MRLVVLINLKADKLISALQCNGDRSLHLRSTFLVMQDLRLASQTASAKAVVAIIGEGADLNGSEGDPILKLLLAHGHVTLCGHAVAHGPIGMAAIRWRLLRLTGPDERSLFSIASTITKPSEVVI